MIDGLYPGEECRLNNNSGLPVVKTCYKAHELNQAIQEGHKVCVLQIKESPELKLKGLLLRNRTSGVYSLVSDRTMFVQYSNVVEYPEDDWETIHEVNGYARNRPASEGWGAYILPLGVQPGDRVYIEDLIEDIVAQSFWYSVGPAVDGEGIWNGTTLEIDHKMYRRFTLIG